MPAADNIADILDQVDELYDLYDKGLDEQFDGLGYGMHRASREEVLSFYTLMLQQYPLVAMQGPEGEVEAVSPWVLCLREGWAGKSGTAAWKRIEAALAGASDA